MQTAQTKSPPNPKALLHKILTSGFMEIIIGGTVAKAMSFVSIIVLSRLLSKSDYGLLSYADNIRNYILLFSGLGLQNSVLRYTPLAKTAQEKAAVFKTSLFYGSALNLIIAAVTLLAFRFYILPVSGASQLVGQMCLLPTLIFVFDCSQLYLRADFRNRDYAKLSVLYAFAFMAFQMVFAYSSGLQGVVVGRYLSFAVIIFACVHFVRARDVAVKTTLLRGTRFREIFHYGLLAMLASLTSLVIPLDEQLIVGSILKSTEYIAEYRVASTIPMILSFFSVAVITFVFPYFSRNEQDKKWVWVNYKKVLFLLSGLLLPVFAVLFLFASPILRLIYGSAYTSGGGILRALLIANAVNICIRMPTGNLLAALGRVRFNFYNSLACSIVHIGVAIVFVSVFGLIGSPISIAIVYILSALSEVAYFRWLYGSKCKKILKRSKPGMKSLLFIAHVPLQKAEMPRHIKFFNQMDALRQLGFEVNYIGNDGENYYLCRDRNEIMLLHSKNTGIVGRLRFFKAAKKLLDITEKYDYAYIRSEPLIPPFLSLLKKLHAQGTRVILEIPTYPYDGERLLQKKKIIAGLLQIIDHMCRKMLKKYVDVVAAFCDEDKIFDIPAIPISNGTDVEHIRQRQPSFQNDELNLLAMAKMDLWHGYDRLIEGLRLYYENHPTIKVYLHLVGSGDCLTDWFRLVQKYHLGSYVFFHGDCYGQMLNDLFDRCDLGVSSLGMYRIGLWMGSNLKVSEYCARGLPFLYSCAEMGLDDNVPFARRFSNTGDPIDIADVVSFYKTVLTEPDITSLMHQYAQEHFSWEKQFEKIFSYFDKVDSLPDIALKEAASDEDSLHR